MNQYSKAVEQMRKQGIKAFSSSNGSVYVNLHVGDGKYISGGVCDLELSLREVEKWANLYDADKVRDEVQKIKDADPYETLEEIARIFHYRGWDISDGNTMDTDFIESSDEFLGLVYQAFNPIYKK